MKYDEELVEKSPFLRLMPTQALEKALSCMTEIEFKFGELIVNEGDAADSYYLLTDGRARVIKLTEAGKEVPLQRLRRGDSFGEIGLLSGGPRTATVRASEPTTVLRLERDDFDDIIADFPQMREFVQLQLQHRMLQGFLQQYTRFARTPLPVLQRILQFLKPVEFKKGDIIIRQDDPGGSVFIIEQGRLTVYRTVDGEKQILAYLRPGDYFGELSLLQGMRRTASVAASSDCRLHKLAPEDWQAITDEYSELEHLVKERIARYTADSGADRVPLDFAQTPENARIAQEADFELAEREDEEEEDIPAPGVRFRFVAQIDDMDCGVAAFAMICRHFGRDVSTSWIRQETGTGKSGTRAKDICSVANSIGLEASLIKKERNVLPDLPQPCMLHLEEEHWVVLIEAKENKAKIADPSDKIRWINMDELQPRWTGYAITFEYTDEFRNAPQERQQTTWSWLMGYVGQAYWSIVGACVLMFVVAFGETLLPIFTQQTVDDVLLQPYWQQDLTPSFFANALQGMRWRLFGLGGVLVASLGLVLLQRLILSRSAVRLDRLISEHVISKLLRLPLSYFLNRSSSDLQRRLIGLREIRNFVVNKGVIGLQAAIQILVFFCVMIFLSPRMSIGFIAVMLPIYAGIVYFSGRVLRPAFATLQETETAFGSLQDEIVDGIQAVKASGRENSFRDVFLRNFLHLNRAQMQSQFNIFSFDGTVQAVWLTASVIFLWIGSRLVIAKSLTLGAFVALLILVGMLYSPVVALVRFWADFLAANLLLRRLDDVLGWPSEQSGELNLKSAQSLQGRVEFRDVTVRFGGPESAPALQGVSFAAIHGQLVSIVGRSGSGKTVLAETLAALLQPSQGTVLYDGVPSTEIRLSDLRQQIGLVLRENHIFAGSIRENIAFGVLEPNDERVHSVARTVGIHEQIQNLPDGYNTVIWNRDHRLSGTLREGIALARAIYNDPSVLVLDEVASSLDIETESSLLENLDEAFQGRTVFMVTKRISLAQNADVVLVLDKGRIVEQGSHDDLMARRGLYFHLAGLQGK